MNVEEMYHRSMISALEARDMLKKVGVRSWERKVYSLRKTRCEYCGTKVSRNKIRCPYCNAPL